MYGKGCPVTYRDETTGYPFTLSRHRFDFREVGGEDVVLHKTEDKG